MYDIKSGREVVRKQTESGGSSRGSSAYLDNLNVDLVFLIGQMVDSGSVENFQAIAAKDDVGEVVRQPFFLEAAFEPLPERLSFRRLRMAWSIR